MHAWVSQLAIFILGIEADFACGAKVGFQGMKTHCIKQEAFLRYKILRGKNV